MSRLPYQPRFLTKLTGLFAPSRTFIVGVLCLSALSLSAQSVTWTDSFEFDKEPSLEQCERWGKFLQELGGKTFASVTMTGEFDQTGRTITDPVAATALADLLHRKQPGTITSGAHTWVVTNCQLSACNDGFSISLSVDGNAGSCMCSDTYAIRPQSKTADWGGINTQTSCRAKSQWMKLEFHSGVSIVPGGPTFICEGGSVTLTANSTICSPVQSYLWSNNETGSTINVTEPGFYSVTVIGENNCRATSSPTEVAMTTVAVDAGIDATFCDAPVELNAMGSSAGGTGSTLVNKVCLFDAGDFIGRYVDCDFNTATICIDGTKRIQSGVYSQSVSFENPVELRYKLYHSARAVTDFSFKVNGQQIGAYTETLTSGACIPIGVGGAPYTFSFSSDKFRKHWLAGAENTLTIEVVSTGMIDLAGLAVEVVTSDESYHWSPAAGLDVASIKNPVATPEKNTVYTVTYTDPSGCIATDQVEVKVCGGEAPTVVCKPVTVELADKCTADVLVSDLVANTTNPSGGVLTYTATPPAPYKPGSTTVLVTVSDGTSTSTCETTVTVIDATLPIITAPADVLIHNEDGECSAVVDLGLPETSDNCEVKSVTHDYDGNRFPEGETIVTWTVTDANDNKQTAIQKVTVLNTAPVINAIAVAPAAPLVTDRVVLTISYEDTNVETAAVNWGDHTAIETVASPEKEFEVSHKYSASGSYTAKVTLTDKCGERAFLYASVVVSNPRSGSVSGGGWFNSPRGAYVYKPKSSGKATFAFEANNTNRNHTPHGHVVFNYHNAGLKFRSTQVEQLILRDETATIVATGRINGLKDYTILLSVAEDEIEKVHGKGNGKDKDKHKDKGKGNNHDKKIEYIRVKIWDNKGNVIYDTQRGEPDDAVATTAIGGGSIKIKEEKSTFNEKYNSPVASSHVSSAYPNPFTDWVDVEFSSRSREDVFIQVMNLSGKVIYDEVYPVSEDGMYPLDMPDREKAAPGLYLVVIKQGKQVEVLRLIRK